MSWDSLSPTPQLSDALTAQVDKYGYHAVMIQPTMKLGHGMAAAYATLRISKKLLATRAISRPLGLSFFVDGGHIGMSGLIGTRRDSSGPMRNIPEEEFDEASGGHRVC